MNINYARGKWSEHALLTSGLVVSEPHFASPELPKVLKAPFG